MTRPFRILLSTWAAVVSLAPVPGLAGERVVDDGWHHLRNADPREWTEFDETAEATELTATFEGEKNTRPATLLVRQQDVKRRWTVTLNDEALGTLVIDEIDLVATFEVPAGLLRDGENGLKIATRDETPDDIRLGHVRLVDGIGVDVFSATAEVQVALRESGTATPARLTILDDQGSRAAVWAEESEQLAVRPGVVYTGTGRARIRLRPGEYTVFAGRGFEYGRDEKRIDVVPGKTRGVRLAVSREVDTSGWVACDTHVHTLTESGHGDCTLTERMVTLAGEGVELPISTEHNKHSDYGPTARRLGFARYFTPVVGNEVTTKVGHFNVFPVRADVSPPDHTPGDWKTIFENVYASPGVRAVVLDHGRDVHYGVRPFGPDRHLALVGRNLDGWVQRANAMEVVNSSAQQADVTRLYRNWFGMVNAGIRMTPVGSSDSHDVARHFVGQGRTYLRVDDRDPGRIDVDAAVDAFVAGRVLVSCGLLSTILVDGEHGPGDLVPASSKVTVVSEVRRPSWVECDEHVLFRNGREAARRRGAMEGPWRVELPANEHDYWLAVVATGPGVRHPSWPIAKPYQVESPVWRPRVLGLTGAVFVDADGDGEWTSPKAYAERLLAASENDPRRVVAGLDEYDFAVAAQAASLLHERTKLDPLTPEYRALVDDAPKRVKDAFAEYAREWRESVVARSGGR